MACPTCSATMQADVYLIFHCPRCGTIRNSDGSVVVPALVERCREFQAHSLPLNLFAVWHRLGIAEAIRTPENRPT